MKKYKVYSARLTYSTTNQYICTIEADNLDEVKVILREHYNRNPFFTLIRDENESTIYNKHLLFYTGL